MNHFTREELQCMRFLIKNMNPELINCHQEFNLVRKKLESLIDNYPTHCEHSEVKLDEICTHCNKNKCASFGRLCEDCYRGFEEWLNK